tara:strand:+ start:874 stop:1092 length:219 start_codon:yes stop_codon:yes gene_type:complete
MRKDITDKLAKDFNLQPHIVEKIVKSQFKYVSKIMREKKLEAVRLHYLGVFAIKPSRLKYLIDNKCIEDTSL